MGRHITQDRHAPSPDLRPATTHAGLGATLYDPVDAAAFPQLILRHRDQRWAARVGLDTLTDAEWLAHFGAFEPLPGSLPQPLALRYHGHQFRHYNPDLGDGRGFLFAQLHDLRDGRLLDLVTKGTGQTPWSCGADSRLTLKCGVREVLATAMLEALDAAVLRRLGVAPATPQEDSALARLWWEFLAESGAGFEQAFFDWHGGPAAAARASRGPATAHYAAPAFAPVRAALATRQPAPDVRLDHPYFTRAQPCAMLIEEVEAIWAPIAERDDWTAFHAKLAEIEAMREAYKAASPSPSGRGPG